MRGRQVAPHARAAREVILSAGAIQSPQMLQLSGIGPRDTAPESGIRGRRRASRRRREPAGPLPGAHDRPAERAQVAERRCAQSAHGSRRWAGMARTRERGAADRRRRTGRRRSLHRTRDRRPPGHPVQRDAAVGRQAGRSVAPYSGFTAAVWQCHPASRGGLRSVDDPAQASEDRTAVFRGGNRSARRSSPGFACCARFTGSRRFANCRL